MKKPAKREIVKVGKLPQRAHGHKVLARLKDGVLLLAPATKPKHFTSRQIERTIRQVLKDQAEGPQFASKGA